MLGRVDKNAKKMLKIFFVVLIKYQSVTHVSTSIFQGLFKHIVFRSVALVIKKSWAILNFFTPPGLFTALYPTLCIKRKLQKNPLNVYLSSQQIFSFSISLTKHVGFKKCNVLMD